jgi:hypothetical protein
MSGAQASGRLEGAPETSRFQIVRRLGAGGMGVVFEALDRLRGTRVALKVLRRLSPEALLRFKTEFRALQDLQHPNLVRLDELISDGHQWFFTMERVEGVDFLAHVGAPAPDREPAISHTLEEDSDHGAGPGAPAPPLRGAGAIAAAAAAAPASAGRRFDEARLRRALGQLAPIGCAPSCCASIPARGPTTRRCCGGWRSGPPTRGRAGGSSAACASSTRSTRASPRCGAAARARCSSTASRVRGRARSSAGSSSGSTRLGFDELARRIASLRAVNLIRSAVTTTGPAVEPYHDRVRRVVIAGLLPAVQRELHLRLAVVLEQREADAETLAVHFHEAGEPRRAAAWAAVAASRAAAALAFDRAASLFRMAAAHEPPGTPEGQRLRLGLAEALVNAGHGAEAAAVFEEAALAAEGAAAAELHRKAAEQYLRSGHVDPGFAAMNRVLEPLGLTLPRTPRRSLASLALRRARLRLRGLRYRERPASDLPAEELGRIDTCYSVAASLGVVDHVRGADFQTRNLLWALAAGEPYRISRALAVEAGYAATRGVRGRPRAEYLLGIAGRLARQLDHPHTLGLVEGFTGLLDLLTGEWQSAREHCERAQAILRDRCLGVTWDLDTVDFVLLWAVLYQGELAELSRRVPQLMRDAEERGDRYAVTNLHTSFVPLLRLAADQPLEARREGARAARAWSSDGFHLQHYNFELFSDGQIGLYLGEAAAAHARIAALWPVLRASMLTQIQHLRIEALHVRARCALAAAAAARGGARDRWLRGVERDLRRIARERAPWTRGWVELLAAGIAAGRGDDDGAAAWAREAAARCEATGMRLYAAAARRRLGELLRGDEGGRLVANADAWMAEQGIRDPRRMMMVLAPGFDR